MEWWKKTGFLSLLAMPWKGSVMSFVTEKLLVDAATIATGLVLWIDSAHYTFKPIAPNPPQKGGAL